ncbi:DUF3999 domain-containing protein [uncultured Maribacter sp.]|uniref:DUF3999 domain-containing protein n=1 Tax=uncultured Maribacter sp. TaxID=431308 RepID=UPI0030DD10C1
MKSYSKKIKLKGIENQWHTIQLPNEVFQNMNSNLTDIRVFGVTAIDTIEAPYIHNTSKAIDANSFISFNLLNTVNNAKGYFYTYDVKEKETINEIKLSIKDTNFNWLITLEGSQNQQEWFTLLDDYRILSIMNDQTDYSFTTLKFSDTNFKFYRLLIKSPEKPNFESIEILKKAKKAPQYRDYTVRSFNVFQEEKNTIVNVNLKSRAPLNLLELSVDDKIDYYRPITIQYLVDSVKTDKGYHYNYRTMATRTLSSIEENSFQLPGTMAQKLRIIVSNNDNQPLKFSNISIKGYIHSLTTRFTEPATYFLVYGKTNDKAPNYDIVKTSISIPENISSLQFGDAINILKPKIETKKPLFENQWWLWSILGVIILLLGYFTIVMMKKEI